MKTQNQEIIKQLMDEGDFSPLYPPVLNSKLSYLGKILVSLMLNDTNLNGCVTWKQQTYADKLGTTRQSIFNYFQHLEESGILVPDASNKAGSKKNTYNVSFTALDEYEPVKTQTKPVKTQTKAVKSQTKPVKSQTKPVKTQYKPVKTALHIKKDKEIDKENNKETIKKVKVEFSSYDSFLKGAKKPDNEEQELEDFLNDLDI